MSDEKMLREKARAAVQIGKIPNYRPERTWGGPGVSVICGSARCRLLRTRWSSRFSSPVMATTPGLDKFHVHIRCFAAREFERRGKQ
jgi:hypothetical protein